METKKPAMAGTLEFSDGQVTVELGNRKVEFVLESVVINQYGNQIRRVVMETLKNLDVTNVRITVVDKGLWIVRSKHVWRVPYIGLPTSLNRFCGEVL